MRLHSGKYIRGRLGSVKSGAPISMLSVVWYALGALVLGTLLARWSWILLGSPSTVTAVVPDHNVSENAGKLFGVAAAGSPLAGTSGALPNVQLVGVFANQSGQPGFAVLKLDEQRQVGTVVGESVAPGVKLLEVHSNDIVLERGGVQQKVEMVNSVAAGTGIAPAGK